jgi:HTH-type transcriptional regulator/antitoxin HipB
MSRHVARITDVGQLRTHLLAFRRSQRLTQADLAAMLGVSKQRISAIEAAPQRITVEQFMSLLRAMRVELHLVTPDDAGPSVVREGW